MLLKILGWAVIIISALVIFGCIISFKDKNASKKGNIAAIIFFLIIGSLVGYPLTQTGSGNKHAAAHPQTLKQKITAAADPGLGKITDLKINDYQGDSKGGKIVLVYVKEDNITKDAANYNTAESLEKLFKIKQVREVCYFWQATLVDVKGHESVDTVVKIDMTQKTAKTIVWKNFDYDNLPRVADTYYVSPVLSK